MRRIANIVGGILLCHVLALGVARADDKDKKEAGGVVETKAKSDAAGDNVKTTSVKNDAKKKVEPPASKAKDGAKRSGPRSCDVRIDNRTPWKVQIFIDGDFEGMVSSYGDAVRPNVEAGRTRVWAQAEFVDGPTKTWGPQMFDCSAYGTYTWRLWDN